MSKTQKNNLLAALVFIGFFGLIGGYVSEFYFFNRTFNLGRFLAIMAILGGLIGVACWWRWRLGLKDQLERMRLFSFCLLGGIILFPLLGSWANRWLGSGPTPTPVLLESEQAFYSNRLGVIKGEKIKPSGYFLFFYDGENLRRITNKQAHITHQLRGDTLLLPIRRGLFGVRWVDKESQFHQK